MKKNFLLTLLLIPLLSFVLKPFTYTRLNHEVKHLLVVQPVSLIFNINKGSKLEKDSIASRNLFYTTATLLKSSIPDSISTEYFFCDSITQNKVSHFIVAVNSQMNIDKQAKKYVLPDSIIELFSSSKTNFVLLTYNGGFIRSRKNLVNVYQRSEIANVLVGYGRRPLESSTFMSCFIIDLREKNIVCFERDIWEDKDPTNASTIKFQMTKVIKHLLL